MAVGFEGLFDLVPDGAELQAMEDLVRDDVVPRHGVVELVGTSHFSEDDPVVRRTDLPRVRPILVALAARAAGASQVDGETQYAAELLHLALGVHDLALGREGGRRRRAARRLFRRSVGWLAGNHLTLRALELSRARDSQVFDALVDTLREFSGAQALSRELLGGRIPTRQDWLEHADSCTGALFSFCCRAGGQLAKADPATLSGLGRYGHHLGRLWHIAEDVSVLRHGDAGRHLVARALAGRPVLAVVCAGEVDARVGEAWSVLVRRPEVRAAELLASRVVLAGGLAAAAEVMIQESWMARRALRRLPESRYRDGLDRLAARLAKAGLNR
jgi:geranylgeranyl pyrophosphate synthase